MALSYLSCDRDQPFLMPPDLREWLPAGHLVHLVLDVVGAVDTSSLHVRHPNGGAGRPAYDPDVLLALTLYCACQRVESSRRIEQLCEVDVACRFVCANRVPDHSTIARFLKDNQDGFAALFVETLRLCAAEGMVKVGVVALDGTKIAANASLAANAGRVKLEAEAKSIVEAIVAADAADDARLGDARGDELPAGLADPSRRRDRLARLERCLDVVGERERSSRVAQRQERRRANADEGRKARGGRPRPGSDAAVEYAQTDLVAARSKADRRRVARADAEAAATQAGRRLRGTKPDFDRDVCRAEAALETAKEQRRLRGQRQVPVKAPLANVTDPDSRIMKSRAGWLQGYNAQAVVSADGVIVAAGVTTNADDTNQFVPMVADTCTNLVSVGIDEPIGIVLADAGYASETNFTADGPPRLIATTKAHKLRQKLREQPPLSGPPPPRARPHDTMQHQLLTVEGTALYKLRSQTVEPVFGQIKEARGLRRFRRRGLASVAGEWNFACAVHNTLKLIRHRRRSALLA
jgi:transposase